jgi:hypothetical protein
MTEIPDISYPSAVNVDVNERLAKSQRLRLANATVQPEGPSDPNFWHAIHFRNGASRVALDKIEWASSPATATGW